VAAAAGPQNSGVGLIVPTEFVQLPSKGILYPEGHSLHNKEEIEIKFMTAREEDILSSEPLIKKGVVLDRLIRNLIVDEAIDPSNLLVADRSAILVAARSSGYGEVYEFSISCPSCEIRNEAYFNLEERIDIAFNSNDLDVAITENGTCITKLPKTKAEVEFRLINGYDEKAMTQPSKNKLQVSSTITDQLKRLVISVNGERDVIQLNSFIDILPAYDSRYLRNLVADIAPDTKMLFDFECESCEHQSALEVPITLSFFWPDVRLY
jgi:hypothetical protein